MLENLERKHEREFFKLRDSFFDYFCNDEKNYPSERGLGHDFADKADLFKEEMRNNKWRIKNEINIKDYLGIIKSNLNRPPRYSHIDYENTELNKEKFCAGLLLIKETDNEIFDLIDQLEKSMKDGYSGEFYKSIKHISLKEFQEKARNLSLKVFCKEPFKAINEKKESNSNSLMESADQNNKKNIYDNDCSIGKPNFCEGKKQEIKDALKSYFSENDLASLFKDGDGVFSAEPLKFKGNMAHLIYTFKELYDHDIITGTDKDQLSGWIANNIVYQRKGTYKHTKKSYCKRILSGRYYKNPLLYIKGNKIILPAGNSKKEFDELYEKNLSYNKELDKKVKKKIT